MKTFWIGFEKRAMSLPSGKNIVKAVSGGLEKATEAATHVPSAKVLDYSKFKNIVRKPPSGTMKYGPKGPEFHPNPEFAAHAKSSSKDMAKNRAEHAAKIDEARRAHINKGSTPYTYWQEAMREPVASR